jgi:hypothetical protein
MSLSKKFSLVEIYDFEKEISFNHQILVLQIYELIYDYILK